MVCYKADRRLVIHHSSCQEQESFRLSEKSLIEKTVIRTDSFKITDCTCSMAHLYENRMAEMLYKDIKSEFLLERKAKTRSKSLPWMKADIRYSMNQTIK